MIQFKYKGKLYCPKNPEKKLKQLKITWNDVEIVTEIPKEETQKEFGIEGKEIRYFLHPNGSKTLCYMPISNNFTALEWFKNVMWNGSTGIKWCTPEYLKQLILI